MLVKITGTVSLPLEATDVNELEEAVFQGGVRVMRELMATSFTLLAQQADSVCPSCGHRRLVGDDHVPVQLRPRFGTVPLTRRH